MPVRLKVTIVLPKGLAEAGTVAPRTVLDEMRLAMNQAVLEGETKVKEYLTEIHLIQDGRLRNSIHGRVLSVNIHQSAGEVATSNVKYARIHEYGGTIRPKNGKALAIPWNKKSAQVMMYGSLRNVSGLYVVRRGKGPGFNGAAFLLSRSDKTLGWTLVKSVYIREKAYMRTGVKRALPKIRRYFAAAGRRAIAKTFGQDGGATS